MPSRLNPYLSLRDTAREAMEFYRDVFGGDLTVSTFGESGMPVEPAENDLVMHAQLETPSGFLLMGADTPSSMSVSTNGTVSLSGDDEADLRRWWDGLSEGATPGVPLEKAPWGDTFGMLTDRYGVGWMVNIAG
ncbi:VOC family protein [Rhodococcus kroppenstedtii]|uniref:VOC family protein n=1 Tax=Rhodococcoides kroppenstedtii TaxID=293050 RepID=UPI002953D742|nr:VOC family protein [Rhodococcus kroppenstedtii]MDV7199273.1 VOC family protein [Rhodococcus kroppenstedtii]